MNSRIKFFSCASLVLAGFVLLPGCGGEDAAIAPVVQFVVPRDTDAGAAQRPQVTLTVNNGAGVSGTVVITLVPEHAPQTVANFLSYVNSGFYNGTIFHRHDAGFVLQGGGYNAPVTATDQPPHKATSPAIALEAKVSNVQGTVAMARNSNPNSATSEFFINLASNTALDLGSGGYAAFGYITDMTLVTAMAQAPCVSSTITQGTTAGCLPVPNLVITSAVKTR
jgi:cyclophilin family peptidyl-prolyl cis-trans isomerase